MGRDDARPLPGLQGGTSPARAFQNFMVKAVANRPVENFDTQVMPPDWQVEGEGGEFTEEEYLLNPDGTPVLGPDGEPLRRTPQTLTPAERAAIEGGGEADPGAVNQDWLDPTAERRPPPPPREAPPPRRQPNVLPPLPGQRQAQPEPDEGF